MLAVYFQASSSLLSYSDIKPEIMIFKFTHRINNPYYCFCCLYYHYIYLFYLKYRNSGISLLKTERIQTE